MKKTRIIIATVAAILLAVMPCTGTLTVFSDDHIHSFETGLSVSADGHYHACTAAECPIADYSSHTGDGAAFAAHEWKDGVCAVCGYVQKPAAGAVDISDTSLWYTLEDGKVTVGGIGSMPVYKAGKSPWTKNTDITAVEILPGVTTVSAYAFDACTALSDVKIAYTVTTIGTYAFRGCYKSVTEEEVTTVTGLETVTIDPDSKLTTIDAGAFKNDALLTAFDMPAGVTAISADLFSGCTALENITLQAPLASVGKDAFAGCTNLKGNLYGGGKYIGPAEKPYQCLVTAENQDITACRIHDDAEIFVNGVFKDCVKLTDITFQTGMTVIPNSLFIGCKGLKSVTIPASVTTIEDSAFNQCSGLAEVIFEKGSALTKIGGNAFYKCAALEAIDLPATVSSLGDSAFQSCTALKKAFFPEQITTVGSNMFKDCANLTSVTIPKRITAIKDSAFAGCKAMKTVIFEADSQLTTLGNYTFKDCAALTVLTIPDTVTKVGSGTFSNLPITSFTIPAGVSKIPDELFKGCTKLETITIPAKATEVSYNAFNGCSALKTVTFAAGSKVSNIGFGAFQNCIALTAIEIPSGVTTLGHDAFAGCAALSSVSFANGMALKKIDYNTFKGDVALKTVALPSSVTTIAKNAFDGCAALTGVMVPASKVPTVVNNTFNGCSKLAGIYVPHEAVASYQQAANWSAYADRIFSIADAVDLTVEKPVVGGYLPTTVTANGKDLPYTVKAVEWFDQDRKPAANDAPLAGGDSYRLRVTLQPVAGYAFSPYATVALNGMSISRLKGDGMENDGYDPAFDTLTVYTGFAVYKCRRTEEFTAQAGTFDVQIGDLKKGSVTLTAVDSKWAITDAEGRYLTVQNGCLAISDEPVGWKYSNKAFSMSETTAVKTDTLIGLLSWLLGRTEQTTTYYLSDLTVGAALSTSSKKVMLYHEIVVAEHIYGAPTDTGDGKTHRFTCTNCGDTKSEPHRYDGDTHLCVCGAADPAYISLSVSAKVDASTYSILFFKLTTYKATITANEIGGTVKKVEYSTNNRTFYRGTSFTSISPIKTFYIRVTDSKNKVTVYQYENGTVHAL